MTDTVTRRRFTREDYQALPEGPPYYELINGELVEMTRPRRRHYRLSNRLVEMWNPYARQQDAELATEPNLYLSGVENVYHPDFVYVARERRAIVSEDDIAGVPDVICEILSPSTESVDRGLKLADYARAGVPHVWLIAPSRPVQVEEYRLGADGSYHLSGTVSAPGEWEPAGCPGLRVALAELDAAVAPLRQEPAGD